MTHSFTIFNQTDGDDGNAGRVDDKDDEEDDDDDDYDGDLDDVAGLAVVAAVLTVLAFLLFTMCRYPCPIIMPRVPRKTLPPLFFYEQYTIYCLSDLRTCSKFAELYSFLQVKIYNCSTRKSPLRPITLSDSSCFGLS